jgi:hypothetical protein
VGIFDCDIEFLSFSVSVSVSIKAAVAFRGRSRLSLGGFDTSKPPPADK